jgi:Kef-type K+ transport system membrane component KefB
MPLTFTVAIATLGYEAHAISHDEYYSFIVASMGSGIFLMILIKILYTFFYPKGKKGPLFSEKKIQSNLDK